MVSFSCPENSFRLNSSLCACNPGYLMDISGKNCTFFRVSGEEWVVNTGVDYSRIFPLTIFSFDSIKKITQSQALFVEATLVAVLFWLVFCFSLRLGPVKEGKSVWFRMRFWISQLDFCYATRHWLDDQKAVIKHRTELGGIFSVATWIFFTGLLAALLYQIITKRAIEVDTVRPTNAPDLLSFANDLEFNITTVSSMSCSHLRGLSTVVTGTPGFVDHRVSPLSMFADYHCHNTSRGPTIMLKCNSCVLTRDNYYVSWQFIDLPNDPATAVAFQFNLTAKKNGDNKHVSFVTGMVKNGSNIDDKPKTFRGLDGNVLKFHLFPRLYHNLHNLRLIQPLFHEFLPGSFFVEASQLQASLQRSTDGLINTTVHINFISDYIVETNNANAIGPVSFLANVGGLYAFSLAFFLYCLLQCEHKIKKLRTEDDKMREILTRRRAQRNWDKLRKYVMYTWGCRLLDENNQSTWKKHFLGSLTDSVSGLGSLHRRKQKSESFMDFDSQRHCSLEMNLIPEATDSEIVKSCIAGEDTNLDKDQAHVVLDIKNATTQKNVSVGSCMEERSRPQLLRCDKCLPLPPFPEFTAGNATDISDLQKNLQNLYEYNARLREHFLAAESLLGDMIQKASCPSTSCREQRQDR